MWQWHSIVSNLLPVTEHSHDIWRVRLGVPWRGVVGHRDGNGSHVPELLWDDCHHVPSGSSHTLAWQPHCAPQLAPWGGIVPLVSPSRLGVGRCKSSLSSLSQTQKVGSAGPSPGISHIQKSDIDQLWEALEAIRYETARWVGAMPPPESPWISMWTPGGSGEPIMSYEGASLEGEGMVNCQAYAVAHQSSMGWCRCWPSPEYSCGWAEVGTPRINIFSGDATPGKTEVSFEQWYHEL